MKDNLLIKWDTTAEYNEYPENINRIFCYYNLAERKNFIKWIKLISFKFRDDLDWWVSPPASRNPYFSNLYKNICIIKTLSKLSKKKCLPNLVVVDSQSLKKTITIIFHKKNFKVKVKKNLIFKLNFINNIKAISIYLIQFLIIKLFTSKKKILNKNLILIDTYIINPVLKEKTYYGELGSYIKNKKNVFFVPTIIKKNIYEFISILKNLNNTKNYLFKESFLTTSDFLYSVFYIFRKYKFIQKFKKYQSYDLSLIINDEISNNKDLYSILISLTNFRFVKRLKKNDFIINKVVNWFENQPMDKGWNFGFRTFYHKTELIGYQGFTAYPEYMCLSPTKFEEESNVIPKKIVSISKSYNNLRKEFFPNLNIITGPALRFSSLFNKRIIKNKKFDVTIFLEGASKKRDLKIVSNFIRINKHFTHLSFFIKSHPILPIDFNVIKLPKNFYVLNYQFPQIAAKTNVAICYGSSSTTLEALSYDCKLIIPFDNLLDRKNLQYLKVDKQLYRICSNDQMLINSINYFIKNDNKNTPKKNSGIKSILFNKITKKNIKILI